MFSSPCKGEVASVSEPEGVRLALYHLTPSQPPPCRGRRSV
jgi:hypothetical protein